MKKFYSIVLCLSLTISFNSCQPKDPPAPDCDTVGADLIAFCEAAIACGETGVGVICPECCLAVGAVAAGIASSEASLAEPDCPDNMNGFSKNLESEVILPSEYRISGNPYECEGETHNRVLFYILNNGGSSKVQSIIAGDITSLNQIAAIYSSCSEVSSQDLVSYFQSNLNSTYYNQNLDKFKTYSIEQLFNSSSLSQYSSYIEEIYDDVMEIKQNYPNNTGIVMDYLNQRINGIFESASISSDDELKARSLTFLKHTYFYWYD